MWKIRLQGTGNFLVGRDVRRRSFVCLCYVCARAHRTQWKLKIIVLHKTGTIRSKVLLRGY